MNTLLDGRIYYQQVEFVLASNQVPTFTLLPGNGSPASLVRILSQEVHRLMALCHLIVPETNKYNLLVVMLQEKLWHPHIFTPHTPTATPKMHAAV